MSDSACSASAARLWPPTQYPKRSPWLEERDPRQVKGAVEILAKLGQELNNLYVSPLIAKARLPVIQLRDQ
ncbi:MAG: hypothetical protein LC114_01120 [Bryobacterales bacterium]|nr:hypothetical protein [Bryobacterales bacterium]